MKTRSELIAEMKRIRRETQVDLNTVAYWNEHVRKPDEEPIDPDPGGDMRRLIEAIDSVLASDPGHGPIASLDFQRSH